MSYFISLYPLHSSSLYMFFGSISSSINDVLYVNPSTNFFVFGDFNVNNKE